MKYRVEITETADALIRKIILYIAEQFGSEVALRELDKMSAAIRQLEDNPFIGTVPKYNVLRRQGYLVLVLEKNLVFYKVRNDIKSVTVYAVVDQRQDYLSIIRGL
ncbi:MAG: type II toxin-antitoxin system RelE/ParE family toxin [Lachnospiraceae bacterium]|nr:type II toxin-antitoxin system RelE/ParE family toxin [Lachnospiraceae bacterium]